jgi:hypothetical protein
MYIEKIPHPTQFNVLCATQLFASTFVVVNSSSNVVSTSTLSVGNFTADYAKIGYIDNPGFITLNDTLTAGTPKWNSTFATVCALSSNWSSVYTTVQNTSSNWSSVYTTVQNNSANYILQNGNSPSTTLLVGTNNTQPLHLEANGSARMAILSSGNVGIGTTTPAVRFEVTDNSTSDAVRITQTGTGNALAVYDVASDTTPFVINQDGKVGVGTASPLSSLHVRDTILTTPIIYSINQNQPYLIAGTTSHTGTTADWGTFGFQHRIKSNSGGTGRVSIDTITSLGSAELFTVDTQGNVGIGTNNPGYKLDVAGSARLGGDSVTTQVVALEIGTGRTGSGFAYVDLVGDTTYTDYGLRLLRNNEGANTTSELKHRGTGSLSIITQDSAAINLQTASTNRLTISNTGNVGINTASPTALLTLSGANTVFAVDNTAIFSAKNTSGTYESYLWPRWSDNATYLNFGSGGLNVRNNSNTLRVRVTDGGDIGIGTTSPTAQITLSATSTEHADLNLQSGANSRFWITQPNNLNILAIGGNGTGVPASGVVNITNTGNVGIGTAAPNTTLTVIGSISATNNATINGNLTVNGSIASQGIDLGSSISTDTINPKTSQQLVLNAGESSSVATGQTDELVYINAENGLRVTSSPDNWGGGTNTNWALRSSTLICGPSGNSAFGLSGTYINTIPQATVDIFGLLKFGNRSSAGIHAGGYLSNTWSLAESYKFFTLGSSYFDPIAARWITNFDTGWGSNVVANVAGDGEGIKFYLAPSSGGNVVRSETTNTFNAYERMRIDTSGNVGIGVSVPNERLDVAATALSSIALKIRGRSSDNLGTIVFDNNTGNAAGQINYIQSNINSHLAFATNNTERMRIDSQGRVGIGTIAPNQLLTVSGNISATGAVYVSNDISADNILINQNNRDVDFQLGSTTTDFLIGGDASTSRVCINKPTNTPAGTLEIWGTNAVPSLVVNANNLVSDFQIGSSTTDFMLYGAANNSRIGINTNIPNQALTVVGNISATGTIYSLNGESNQWNSVFTNVTNTSANWTNAFTNVQSNSANWTNAFTTVRDNSANYILQGGNSRGAALTIGTNDNNHLNFETAGSTKLTILSSGNVGIGTTDPGYNLDIQSSLDAYLRLRSTGTGSAWFIGEAGASGAVIWHNSSNTPSLFTVNGTERMRINTSGNVGIGTSAPTTKLHLSGSANFTGTATSTGILFNSHPLLERINIVAGTANNNTTIDAMTNTTWMFTTNSTGDWTPNIRGNISTSLNSIMEIGDTVNITIISKQNSTSFNVAGLQIDTNPQTVGTNLFWEGGTAPTTGLSSSGYDVYTFTIIKRGASSYTTFASQSRLG